VNEEVKISWYSEKMHKKNINQMIEESAEQEVELPDDTMPDIEIPSRIPMQETNVPAKKKSKWGHVQPVRQSSRIDRIKNIMEKPQEMNKINNLEISRMKGIMSINPFNVLQFDEVDNVAKIVGVNIDDDSDSMRSACSSRRTGSLSDKDQHEELAEGWIDVIT
jgi:hypothetical protein